MEYSNLSFRGESCSIDSGKAYVVLFSDVMYMIICLNSYDSCK